MWVGESLRLPASQRNCTGTTPPCTSPAPERVESVMLWSYSPGFNKSLTIMKEYSKRLLEGLKEAGVTIVTALPESLLADFYRSVEKDPDIHYVKVSNEADMPGIVVGAYLGGKRAVMVMENSGIRQACEPIARFSFNHHLPMVIMMAYRGDWGEYNWWGIPHGQTMEPILDALRIPCKIVRRLDEVKPVIKRGIRHAESSQWPVAIVYSGECVEVPHYTKD